MHRTILIVDDHKAFRRSASALLQTQGFDVIGTAADGADAIEQAARLRPEVVLLDIQLPDVDGFAVAEQLAAVASPPDVVLTSSRERAAYGSRLEMTRALGFIPKRALSGASLAALID